MTSGNLIPANKRQTVNGDNIARQVRGSFANGERERAAEAVTDDRQFMKFLETNVADSLIAHVIEEVTGFHGCHYAKARDRDDVAFVFVLQMLNRAVPNRPRRSDAGNEKNRFAMSSDLDVDELVPRARPRLTR